MKKIIYIFLAVTFLFSCSDGEENNAGTPQPFIFHFLVNKNSELYKEMDKEYSKKDYTHQPPIARGFNNVYFLKGNKKFKTMGFLKPDPGIIFGSYMIGMFEEGTLKNYGYFTMHYNLAEEILTGDREEFVLVYGNKKLPLKIKGKTKPIEQRGGEYEGWTAMVEEFYVNGKKCKFFNSYDSQNSSYTYNIVLYLEE